MSNKITAHHLRVVKIFLFLSLFGNFCDTFATSKSLHAVLIVSCDTRELEVDYEISPFYSGTAAINFKYAQRHGYDFLRVTTNQSSFVSSVNRHYSDVKPQLFSLSIARHPKYFPASFNVNQMQFRGPTWVKLLVLWEASMRGNRGASYKYILFLDSDIAINPLNHHRSIEDAFTDWETNSSVSVMRGQPNLRESGMIFWNNHPWRQDMPCTGAILIRPDLAEPLLREWWDYNLTIKNFEEFHEQDVIWHMLDHWQKYGFLLNDTSVTLLTERQIISEWTPLHEMWLCHVPTYHEGLKPLFRFFLRKLNLNHKSAFEIIMHDIKANFTVVWDMLSIAERMDAASKAVGYYGPKTVPPYLYNEKTEDSWHMRGVSFQHKMISPVKMFEGFVISKKKNSRDLWLVSNGTRRVFPDMDTLLALNFTLQDVLKLKDAEVESIPMGASVTVGNTR